MSSTPTACPGPVWSAATAGVCAPSPLVDHLLIASLSAMAGWLFGRLAQQLAPRFVGWAVRKLGVSM